MNFLESFNQAINLSIQQPHDPFYDELHLSSDLKEIESYVERIIQRIFDKAIIQGASDIHIEPMEHSLIIRFRIDGRLQMLQTLHANWHKPLSTRLKLLAHCGLAESRLPQEGRFSVQTLSKYTLDVRLASMPSAWGDAITLRILNQDKAHDSLSDLGFSLEDLKWFESQLMRLNGLLLMVGPTGCGKSTTLYAALQFLAEKNHKIISLEDPVERQIPKINQVQINKAMGLTFEQGLKAILRQSPNVIMIGEIRDPVTAEYVFQAALTGHLVLSTLHTYDACSAIFRLIDLGIKPYLLSQTLLGVIAQRLLRHPCPHCFQKSEILDCFHCQSKGYRGRKAYFECLKMTPSLKKILLASPTLKDLKTMAIREGLIELPDEMPLKSTD